MDDGFELLGELPFDVDEDEANRSYREVLDDETLMLLRRENRVGIARGPVETVTGPELLTGRSRYAVPLLFVLHAHPECTFVWSRFMVDLSPTADCVIADMAPRQVEDLPVEVDTSVGVDLTFSVASNAVDLGAKPELSRKRTVYFPIVLASGVGFRKAYWDFLPKAGDYLHTDKELKLLVDAPVGTPVQAVLTIRAKVRFRGLSRLIPLLARTGHNEVNISLA